MNGKRKKTPFEHGREFIIWTTEGHRVGLVDGPSNADMEEKFMANARLIAAAPDLLAALRAIVARINGAWDDPDLMAFGELLPDTEVDIEVIASQAIAKTRGGE